VKYAEYCRKISEAGKRRPKEVYERVGAALRGQVRSAETRKKISEGQKGKKRPGYIDRLSNDTRKKLSEATKGLVRTEENRKKISDAFKGKPKSEDHKQKISEAKMGSPSPRKGAVLSDSTKAKLREHRIGKRTPEETKARMCEVSIGGFWYGNVRYTNDPQYCEKWTEEFRERVRSFFNYTCQFPGCGHVWKPGEKRLAVHHINYRKDSCCNPNVIPLFAPVCPGTCHAKTNNDRESWEKHFSELIMQKYDGKCFFTKEEMRALKGKK
jgi:hypothetical protein